MCFCGVNGAALQEYQRDPSAWISKACYRAKGHGDKVSGLIKKIVGVNYNGL